MKKKLEAELISIAHRILKLKNKSELIQLQHEARNLYEKLSVLLFVEENFAEVKPTIGRAEADEILETAFDEKDIFTPETVQNEDKIVATPSVAVTEAETPVAENDKEDEDDTIEPVQETAEEVAVEEPKEESPVEALPEVEEILSEKEVDEVIAEAEEEIAAANEEITAEEETDIPAEENVVEPTAAKEDEFFKPAFEWAFEPKAEEKKEEVAAEPKISGQIAFEDLLGAGYVDPVFVKPEETAKPFEYRANEPIADPIPISRREDKVPVFKMNNAEIADRTLSLNDRLSKGITVGLNDRIAFVKHLFGNSNEDYNRVLSQLITFNTFAEAQEFIDQMVKPDYNNWDGKDEYAQRFMEVVEKKFA